MSLGEFRALKMLKELMIFTTGGTIDKIYFDKLSSYQVGEPVVERILKQAGVTFRYTSRALTQKDSLDLDERDRRAILEAIMEAKCKHVLVTHGTDTMVETAQLLAKRIVDKVVVLTGALKPARFAETDAIFNIGLAIGALQSMSSGIYIAMNGQVFRAGQVRKNREANQFELLP